MEQDQGKYTYTQRKKSQPFKGSKLSRTNTEFQWYSTGNPHIPGLEVVPEAVGLMASIALLVTVHVTVVLCLHTETISSALLVLQCDGFAVPQYCLHIGCKSAIGVLSHDSSSSTASLCLSFHGFFEVLVELPRTLPLLLFFFSFYSLENRLCAKVSVWLPLEW